MKKRRYSSFCLALVVMLVALAACGGNPESSTPSAPETTTTTIAAPSPKEIPFTVKKAFAITEISYREALRSGGMRLLLSAAQVTEAKLEQLEFHPLMGKDAEKIDTSEYTDTYFADKALVLLYCVEPSGSSRIAIDTAVVEQQKLTVSYTTKTPMPAVTEGAEWCILLEVNRADVADVTEIEGMRTEVTLPSGQKLE